MVVKICLTLKTPNPQIVSCLCELAEANARELKSGWKALFRSLRSVKVRGVQDLNFKCTRD